MTNGRIAAIVFMGLAGIAGAPSPWDCVSRTEVAYRMKDYAGSADAYAAGIEVGATSATTSFNAACSAALAGRAGGRARAAPARGRGEC